MVSPKPKRRKQRRVVETWGSYLFQIEHVHSHYSFGDGYKLDRTAYAEFLQPQIQASCLAPEKFKGRNTKLTMLGNRSLEHEMWNQTPEPVHISGVGTLTFRGDRSEFLGSLPFDALWNVVLTTLAGGFHFIYLHGAAMKNGTARISSIGFYEEFDLEDA